MPPRQRPHLVRWVRQFLAIAAEHRGYTFHQAPQRFLAWLGQRPDIGAWQIEGAANVIRTHRYADRACDEDTEGSPVLGDGWQNG